MSDKNFSRRRRGMRFRPSGGLGNAQPKTDREANQARAEVVGGTGAQEKIYDHRHTNEIERAENIAAGLPPGAATHPPEEPTAPPKGDFRQPHADTPAQVQEEKPFQPVSFTEPPKGIVETIRSAANTLVKRVQRLIRPIKKVHKEVIINAESLETRVADAEARPPSGLKLRTTERGRPAG